MVTCALGKSFCTAMAMTWLIEWRMRSSCSLSLVFGSWIGASARVISTAAAAVCGELDATAGTGIQKQQQI
jgi:hypothetical protein